MSLIVITPDMVRDACTFIGRYDACNGRAEIVNGSELLRRVSRLLHASHEEPVTLRFPVSGPGALLSDWWPWYSAAHESATAECERAR